MWTLNRILTALFDFITVPLNALPYWASLTLLSAGVGLVALVVVKYTSHQAAITRIKDDIQANMLAIKLFKDEMRVMFRAQRRLIWAALRLQYRLLPPLLVMFVPFVLMVVQMSLRYQWRPLRVGEEVLLTATLPKEAQRPAFDLQVRGNDGFDAFNRVRALADFSVSWRLRAQTDGLHTIEITNGKDSFTKQLPVGERVQRVCPVRPGRNLLEQLIYPAEEPFAASSPVQAIRLERFPLRESWYAGADWWAFWFLVMSIVLAFVFKPLLKVQF